MGTTKGVTKSLDYSSYYMEGAFLLSLDLQQGST